VRGLARLLRRNPTEAERTLWHALVNDRRFAGRGFKRQTPIGPHICDFVSFPLRLVVDLKPAEQEEAAAAKTRADRRAWLAARGYRVIEIVARDIEADIGAVLDRLAARVQEASSTAQSSSGVGNLK
jgi:tRNA/rRNA methyltransferase